MHLTHLGLTDFRSYPSVEVDLAPGITTFLGRNGQGKTNLVEAAGYLASLSSHRVFTDAPLVRQGAHRAAVRAVVVRAGRPTQLEMEINPGRANRARLNRSPVSRPQQILGSLRTVLFAPEDLALVKGDPSERRRFLDDLLVTRQPRWSGVRSDYDKVLKQRNALLRSASSARRGGPSSSGPADEPTGTLEVWTTHLAQVGSALQYARLRLLRDLLPHLATCYDRVSDSDGHALATYQSSLAENLRARIAGGEVPAQEDLADGLHASAQGLRDREIERGVSLVGPHRDDIQLSLGDLPARGYASHGESWSFALGLRLAAYQLLRHDLGEDPVLVLDDVFAELDAGRRERLAEIVADCEQVLVTAAVDQDVPRAIASGGATFDVRLGQVQARG